MHIRLVFQKLSDNNIKLGRPKCIFGASSVKALGHVVGGGVMKPDPENVAAILNLPIPRDVTMVRSVLSAASYYRTYVDKFALISEPMANLLKKNVKFEWTPECQEAFHKLKSCLTKEPLLRLPNFRKPFILTTDWSKVAIGAVLSQIDEATEFDHPVAFASRLLNSAERNYAPTEGECLALVWAIEKFRHFLDGRHFIVYTDHAALQWLNTERHANSKLERWALRLQEYTFTVIHKKGEENLVADCLSRCVYAEALYAFAIDPVWPAGAKTQKDLDEIPCVVCGYPQGDDNNRHLAMGVNGSFHLRMSAAPRSLPLVVRLYCPDVTFILALEEHVINLRDRLEEQYQRIALELCDRMQQQLEGHHRRAQRRKRKQTELQVGDLVLEAAPGRGPLQNSLRGPYRIIALNPAKTIAVLHTGSTLLKGARVFKRHTSHLVRYYEPSAVSGEGAIETSHTYSVTVYQQYIPIRRPAFHHLLQIFHDLQWQ
eukprot:jgi/Botrbrau1/16348/Bobra.178_1s0001.1